MHERVRKLKKEILSDNWYQLYKYSYDYLRSDGQWESHHREVYDRGNGAAILLINPEKGTVILTRQFRMPTLVNGNDSGMMIEVCAGLLDGMSPDASIKKEVLEETGYSVPQVSKVMETYMSPGAVTEILYLYTAVYNEDMKVGEGGGAREETEDIEIMELPFTKALDMISTAEIQDAKTILLLQYAAINGLLE